jgi:dihydrolipoamide dehydrogenase
MKNHEKFDMLVVGSGPGGYAASLRAAKRGLKVAIVERESRVGGLCLTAGCIPGKSVIHSSINYHLAKVELPKHGIRAGDLQVDLPTMMDRKNKVVDYLCENIREQLTASGVHIVHGSAHLIDADRIEVSGIDQIFEAKNIVLATGSTPAGLPDMPFDGKYVVDASSALNIESVPKHLVIMGGGYIGIEFGSAFARFGAEVTVLQKGPKIAAMLDGQITRVLEKCLAKQGVTFRVRVNMKRHEIIGDRMRLLFESDQSEDEIVCDKVLVAIGRLACVDGLGLEQVGVKLDDKTGLVQVDECCRTNVPNVYAIGDLTAGPQVAQKAYSQGIAVAETIAGTPTCVDLSFIPTVVYTIPEVACLGLNEEELKVRNRDYVIGTHPFAFTGRARSMGMTEGLAKVLVDPKTDEILGIHIIGPNAIDMIGECSLGMQLKAKSSDFAQSLHGHPAFAEALHEAFVSVHLAKSAPVAARAAAGSPIPGDSSIRG